MASLEMTSGFALMLGVLACSQRPPIFPHHVAMLWADLHIFKMVFRYVKKTTAGENQLVLTKNFSRQVTAGEVARNVIVASHQGNTLLLSTINTTVTAVTGFHETVKLHLQNQRANNVVNISTTVVNKHNPSLVKHSQKLTCACLYRNSKS